MAALVFDAEESAAVYDLAVKIVEASGSKVLTQRQVARLDRALPHRMEPEGLRCLPECERCQVISILV